MSLKNQLDLSTLPKHIAIIMDGNGRWAKNRGKIRVFGHENGVTAVRETAEAAAELGIENITLFAFSLENWKRPKTEVNALMSLLVSTIKKEAATLQKNNIRLNTIGDISALGKRCHENLLKLMEQTKNNTQMTLTLALNYSGKWDITQACKAIATKCASGELSPSDIDDNIFNQHLSTYNLPEPELLIRTSGEYRISNFLLWQTAYSEFFFTPTLWPDFRREHLYEAITDFQSRERRFGHTSEQIKK